MVGGNSARAAREALRYVTKTLEDGTTVLDLTASMALAALGDPAFYVSCPIFLFLRKEAMEISEASCKQCVKERQAGLVSQFVSHIALQYELCVMPLMSTAAYLVRLSDAVPEQRCLVKIRVRYNGPHGVKTLLF